MILFKSLCPFFLRLFIRHNILQGRKRADQQPAAEAGNPQPGGKTAKAVPTGPMDEQSRMKALRDLKALLDEGIITQQEFEAKKKSYLGF